VGSTRSHSQGAESGRRDGGCSTAVFAKLGSIGRFAWETGPGYVGIAGGPPGRRRLARLGRHTCRSSRAHMGVTRRTLRSHGAGKRLPGTPSHLGIAATARSAGPRGSCAELGRTCAVDFGGAGLCTGRSRSVVGRPRGSGAGMERATCSAGTSVGIAGRTVKFFHPDGAILEPAGSGMEPSSPGGASAGGARLNRLGRAAKCGSGATAHRRTVVE
jgi:hypothetical protein